MILEDFHMHTTFCDGVNTPEEMVQAAIRLGMKRIGFSAHAPVAKRHLWDTTSAMWRVTWCKIII